MTRPRIHLIAPAGSCRPFLDAIADGSADRLISLVQQAVGDAYEVTANKKLLMAEEEEDHGGRSDDAERVADIQSALADDRVACLLSLRGGAWLTRILPDIDFTVLDRRTTRVAVVGFSEMTTLINIVAAHENGVGVYDMSPAFLVYGLKRFAMLRALANACAGSPVENVREALPQLRYEGQSPEEWMRLRLTAELCSFLCDVVAMFEGRGSQRRLRAELVRGELTDREPAVFIGGNLCLFTTFLGTPFEAYSSPDERWLVLEDINDKPERIDRFLARLKLAGYFERCAGVLLGDFHNGDRTHTQAVIELMPYHLPPTRNVPVLVSQDVGHVWPVSPLPLSFPVELRRQPDRSWTIEWSAPELRVFPATR